ncbi:aspartate aminotransferase family protein [SAR202 cluster bacterium AD-804-J14_MRT_500m]|nr:aspartate aminotransferase family protein [SAR202 cluster bacterium AD-804-J14_MRT_500m]
MEEPHIDQLSRQAKEHLWPHYTGHNTYGDMSDFGIAVEAKGNYYIDDKGKRYLDGTGGSHCCLIGHGRQEVADAVYQQMNQMEFIGESLGLRLTTVPTTQLSARLAQMTPGDLSKVYFSLSATEAIEDALKMVIQYQSQAGNPRKYKILFRDGSHHGYTFGAMAVSGDRAIKSPIFSSVTPSMGVMVPEAHEYRCRFCTGSCNLGCAIAVEDAIQFEDPETVAAFMMEPVAKGAIVPHADYWTTVRAICDKYGILIIDDEAVTGFGRTGTLFGVDHWGLKPDIMILGKTLASGYQPIGATITTTKVAEQFVGPGKELKMAHTLAGHPAGTAAAIANLDIIERENLVERSKKLGEYLLIKLETLMEHHIVGEVRGIGLLAAVDLVKDKNTKQALDDPALGRKMTRFMLDNGLYFYTRGTRLEIHPPLTITEAEIDDMISILDQTMNYAERELNIK